MRQTWHTTNQQHTVTLVKYIYIYILNIYQHTTSGGWWWGRATKKKRGTAATTSSLDAVRSPTGDGQWQPAPLNVAENSQQQPTHTQQTHTGAKQCGLGLQHVKICRRRCQKIATCAPSVSSGETINGKWTHKNAETEMLGAK